MKGFLYFLFILLHHPIRLTTWLYAKTKLKLKTFGRKKLPQAPYIICSNHNSHLDGLIISSLIRHKIRWLITRKHYCNKKMKWAYVAMKLIPVDMTRIDSVALKLSLNALKKKKVLGIFPEGTRSLDGNIQENIHMGAAYLSIKSGVTILPIAVKGTYKALPPGTKKVKQVPVSIVFGEVLKPPIDLNRENIQTFSMEIMSTIRRLFEGLPDRQ